VSTSRLAREAARWVHARSHALDWHALAGNSPDRVLQAGGPSAAPQDWLGLRPRVRGGARGDRGRGVCPANSGPRSGNYASLAMVLAWPDRRSRTTSSKSAATTSPREVQMFSNTAALLQGEGNWESGCGPLAQGAKHLLSRQRTTLRVPDRRIDLRRQPAGLTHDVALVRRPPKSVEDRHRVEVVAPATDLASLDCEHRDVPVGVGSSGPNDATL
jgi:hypothetical protein